jgi:hypothetical protein
MSKKGPLSKTEKFYIENNTDADIETISKDLDRSVSLVTKHIKENCPKTDPRIINVGNLMARKEDRGVTIMTESASSASDSNREIKKKPNPPWQKSIHKIKDT